MERNNKILIYSFISITTILFISCFGGNNSDDKDIYNTYTKYLTLSESVGKYYYLPSVNDEDYPNYETFNLKKGDSILLNINSDSSFIFNHFYYNKMKRIDNYHGIISKDVDEINKIHLTFPNESFDLQGFLLSEEDTIFFHRLSMKHYENYEYRLFYKKLKKSREPKK